MKAGPRARSGKLKTALKEESAKHQFLYGNVLLFNAGVH